MASETAVKPTREHLLESAASVIKREGAAQMTLDLVAKEAGVSKGGLLYHFPSKHALFIGLVEHSIAMGEEQIANSLPAQRSKGSWIEAYVRAKTGPHGGKGACADGDLVWAIMGASANDPTLMDPLRAAFKRWQGEIDADGLDPAIANLLRFAADGMWAAQIFGLAPPTPELREKILAEMDELLNRHKSGA